MSVDIEQDSKPASLQATKRRNEVADAIEREDRDMTWKRTNSATGCSRWCFMPRMAEEHKEPFASMTLPNTISDKQEPAPPNPRFDEWRSISPGPRLSNWE